jgi:hypothetical protein
VTVESSKKAGEPAPTGARPTSETATLGAPAARAEGGRVVETAPPRETGFSGQLSLFALPELLELLRGGQRTGRLQLSSRAGAGSVRLRRGKVTGASSPRAAGIGGYLIEGGVVSREQLNQALASQQQEPQRRHLGLLLIERHLASAADIRTALVAQVHEAFRELKDWTEGDFTFQPETPTEPSVADIELELDPRAVLLTVFTEEDDRQRDAR